MDIYDVGLQHLRDVGLQHLCSGRFLLLVQSYRPQMQQTVKLLLPYFSVGGKIQNIFMK